MDHPPGDAPIGRRETMAAGGTLALASLAGCLGGGQGTSIADDAGTPATELGTPANDPSAAEPLGGHPAAIGITDQPWKGPDPTEAESVIVAFEDPSCTRCLAFEQNTVPRIEDELVASGTASFVFRGYPVVYEWGEPASHALEAVYARSEAAFWALKDHYYGTQPEFATENVLDRTRVFLDAQTDIDTQSVVEAVESGATGPAVQADLNAGMNAGAGRTTPHIYLFRDGQYQTKAAGSVSFSVITNALGL